jgi:anti-sigma B factor antagonist
MEFKIEKLPNYTLIQVLEEKLDTHIAPTLKSELVLVSGNGEKNIVLDLSKCRYCDSSGLSAILVANRLCKNANGTFVLTGLNDAVERLITISQLDTVLNIAGSIEEAVKLFAETAS